MLVTPYYKIKKIRNRFLSYWLVTHSAKQVPFESILMQNEYFEVLNFVVLFGHHKFNIVVAERHVESVISNVTNTKNRKASFAFL